MTRQPCKSWREGVSASELFVGTLLRLRAGAIAWEVETVKTSGLARWCNTLKSGIVSGGPDEAKLAAEDAARALILDGLAVLGGEMPEGFGLTRLRINGEPGYALHTQDGDNVYLLAAQAEAVALAMLAATRRSK